jgi:transposase
MHALVHPADVQDRDGGVLVMATLFGAFPFLLKLYADGGYQGPEFRRGVDKVITDLNVEIVKRSDQSKGFVVLPKRWVVERTFAWLCRCRRLAKDWECLSRKALAFLRLASIASCSENSVILAELSGQTLRARDRNHRLTRRVQTLSPWRRPIGKLRWSGRNRRKRPTISPPSSTRAMRRLRRRL